MPRLGYSTELFTGTAKVVIAGAEPIATVALAIVARLSCRHTFVL